MFRFFFFFYMSSTFGGTLFSFVGWFLGLSSALVGFSFVGLWLYGVWLSGFFSASK
jgi:hypothetical protein